MNKRTKRILFAITFGLIILIYLFDNRDSLIAAFKEGFNATSSESININ